jgi:hypothetical protein
MFDAIAPEKPDEEVEVVRRLIVPDVADSPTKSDDPRSPGVTDRDVIAPKPSSETVEEAEVIRRPVVPNVQQAESSSSQEQNLQPAHPEDPEA